ncbi:hypothetical protein ABBQ38_001347 [Trebouxia sp. C0009 RCD-2024]
MAAPSPGGGLGDGVRNSRSAPFSLHSRGVQLLDTTRLFDATHQIKSASRHLRDLLSSLYVFALIQSWLSLYNVLITISATAFYSFYHVDNNTVAFGLDWILVAFVIILPMLGFTWLAFGRREEALRDLVQVKSLLLHIYLAHRHWLPSGSVSSMHQATVQQLLFSLVDGMRAYFLPPRFYSRHYPYTGVKRKMMKIATERAKLVRGITATFKKLSRSSEVLQQAGLSDVQLVHLASNVYQLQCAFERMAVIKEYRTPQGIRALARFYVVVFIPLFFGPYYAAVRVGAHSFAFSLFLAIFLNLALVGLLNVSLALEDPFDNQGLDGIYVDEALFEAEQAIAMDEDAELAGLSDQSGLKTGTGAIPAGAMMATPGDQTQRKVPLEEDSDTKQELGRISQEPPLVPHTHSEPEDIQTMV